MAAPTIATASPSPRVSPERELLMPHPDETVEIYLQRLRALQAQLSALIEAVERGRQQPRAAAAPGVVTSPIVPALPSADAPPTLGRFPRGATAPPSSTPVAGPRPSTLTQPPRRPIGAQPRRAFGQETLLAATAPPALGVTERRAAPRRLNPGRRVGADDRRDEQPDLRGNSVERRLGTEERRTHKRRHGAADRRGGVQRPASQIVRQGTSPVAVFWVVQVIAWAALAVIVLLLA